MADISELQRLHGKLLVNLAVLAEANEFEAGMRVEEIGTETFWEAVTARLRDVS